MITIMIMITIFVIIKMMTNIDYYDDVMITTIMIVDAKSTILTFLS